ncbi:MAG: DUF5665 domain-containing protein [bacterium]|nr:DUF5665 domain-containing protein [bacterium]
MKNTSKNSKRTDKYYENLGRIVASVYETGYLDVAKSYKMSFLKGVFSGVGGVIGATIIVALLLWILSVVKEVPFIGDISKKVESSINEQK